MREQYTHSVGALAGSGQAKKKRFEQLPRFSTPSALQVGLVQLEQVFMASEASPLVTARRLPSWSITGNAIQALTIFEGAPRIVSCRAGSGCRVTAGNFAASTVACQPVVVPLHLAPSQPNPRAWKTAPTSLRDA